MNKRFFILIIGLAVVIGATSYAYMSHKTTAPTIPEDISPVAQEPESAPSTPEVLLPQTIHMATPEPVKALYISSWVTATPKLFDQVIKLIDETEANAVVLDIKDATGRISFLVDDPIIKDTGSPENRIKDIKPLLEKLHAKNIYIIGRISTFQDPYLAKVRPEWALKKLSDGGVWKDRKGLAFLDPANESVIEYMIALGKAAYDVGFDEINYDYIRYPSDGNVKDIDYQLDPGETRTDNIAQFAERLNKELKQYPGLMLSADLFGLTTTEKTDMGIGQVFERMLPHFDFIAPMIYPSHYNKGEYGIKNPSEQPYETIMKALAGAKKKVTDMATTTTYSASGTATTSVDTELADELYKKVRPWLQDFSIRGTTYDAAKVRAQIQATYDSGLTSWMMWDPSNKYTDEAYQKDPSVVY